MMMSYYKIGLSLDDIPGFDRVVARVRKEAGEGAVKAVTPVVRKEAREQAAIGARQAVLPLIIGSTVLPGVAILIALSKR